MSLRDELRAISSRTKLPNKDQYMRLLGRTITILEHEDSQIRPADSTGLSGGMVVSDPQLPTLIVPDLHARRDLFFSLLEYPLFGEITVLTALEEGRITLVCLGDALHAERRALARWLIAWEEYLSGWKKHKAMSEEMIEGLSLIEMVMRCKGAFPNQVHFLKGNHENIMNEEGNGNHAFMKFAHEGEMVRSFLESRMGTDFLQLYALFEKRLPLFVLGNTFLASHAEPARFFTREELIEARNSAEVMLGLTWTANGVADQETVRHMIESYVPDVPGAVYFAGHRPVSGAYAHNQHNNFIQIHNPEGFNLAFVPPDRPFTPEKDIINLAQGV